MIIHIWFVIYSLPFLLTNASSFYDTTKQEKRWAFSDILTYILGQWGNTVLLGSQGPCYSTQVEFGRGRQPIWAYMSSPQQAAAWKTAELEGLENVKVLLLKGFCERWDQLKFHLTLILLNHCSVKKMWLSPVCSPCFFLTLIFIFQILGTMEGCACFRQLLSELNNVLIEKIVADMYLQSAYL